jgi:hypothetical protein
LKIHFNITFPSMPGSFKSCISTGFPTKTLYMLLFSPICATCPAHLILHDLITEIIFGKECRLLYHIESANPSQHYLTAVVLKWAITETLVLLQSSLYVYETHICILSSHMSMNRVFFHCQHSGHHCLA